MRTIEVTLKREQFYLLYVVVKFEVKRSHKSTLSKWNGTKTTNDNLGPKEILDPLPGISEWIFNTRK